MSDHGVSVEGLPLDALPEPAAILAAFEPGEWVRAEGIARRLDVVGSRRLGRRASKGNWSGRMKPGVRLAGRLLAMHRAGQLLARRSDYVWEYRLPGPGEVVTTHWEARRTPAPRRPDVVRSPKKPLAN